VENFRGGFGYRCVCGKEVKTSSGLYKHGKKCEEYLKTESVFRNSILAEAKEKAEQEGKIKCLNCSYWGHNLKEHIKNNHNLTLEQYSGQTLSEPTKENYSNQNKENGDWITREKEKGTDLKEYFKHMGESVSRSILNNPKERKRRSQLLGNLNKREDFRYRASETAKKTSNRKDIQEQRALRLKKWREENPEEFYEKCIKQMHKFKSKPEKDLFRYLIEFFEEFEFKNNQQIQDNLFSMNKTRRKQVDIISKENKVIVEVDGPYHFKPIRGEQVLKNVVLKDKALNKYAFKEEFLLVRISTSQYDYRGEGEFSEKCLDKLNELLYNRQPGIFFLGEEYGENNCL